MNIIDFLIGLTLINALPHFVLGVWKGRMLSGLGFGNKQNILYGLINFTISITLFLYKYGFEGLTENGIYLGALFVVVAYFVLGKLLYRQFHEKFYAEMDNA